MVCRVAINGFGRIGRLVYRIASKRNDIEIVAINDLIPADALAYLLKYDTVHGRFDGEIKQEGQSLIVNGKETKVFSERDPAALPWKEFNIDYVVESTGFFCDPELAKKHLEAGAKRVILSAPAKGEVPTFVMGVNHTKYKPETDTIVSNASCTTNCLAPIAKVLLDNFGIEEGLMTTVHAVTSSQLSVDGPSMKDWRGGRGAYQNIIPSSTGAAKAVALCLPELKGKLTGMALRVPVADVSVVDLTVRLSKETTYGAIVKAMKNEAEGDMKGVLDCTNEPVVSSDFISTTFSSVFDEGASIQLNPTFVKIIAWYDNEMGYAARIVDLVGYIAEQEDSFKKKEAFPLS